MPTTKQVIGQTTGTARATQYKKSARTSAISMARNGVFGKTVARRKSLGGSGG